MLKKGDILNQTYQIVEEIGEGGNGVVYLAIHLRLRKKVVVKKIKNERAKHHNVRKEADILKNLHHRYLPQVYDFYDEGNDIYTVIDFIPGRDMKYYIERNARFDERRIILWLRQLLEALEYLHSQTPPIIHSDIKPSNIMVRPDGDICLIDFNVSMSEGSGKISGFSQRYASPEQVLRKKLMDNNENYQNMIIDERSDIYSLGISIYCLMTGGRPPSDKDSIPPLSACSLPYSQWLKRVIDNMMKVDSSKRYPSAKAAREDLGNIKKKDREYSKLLWWHRGISIIGLILLTAGIGMVSAGLKEISVEEFDEDYAKITEEFAVSDFDSVTLHGVSILNDKKYRIAMKEEPVKKADILYIIANAYFEQEDYQNASGFYEEAISYNPDNPEYYRDYAIVLAREENMDGAETILNKAMKKGLEKDGIYLVKAEIHAARDEHEEAVKAFQKLVDITENSETRTRAYLLCARSYREQQDYEKECRILEECWEKEEDVLQENKVLRALGAAYTRYADVLSETEAEKYLNKAASAYEKIIEHGNPTFTDYMNIVVLCQATMDYQQCMVWLEKMKLLYPDDYRVYMRSALILCEAEGRKNQEQRDYSDVKMYYDQAEQYYQSVRNSGQSDENMQILEDAVTQLYEKGWLTGG